MILLLLLHSAKKHIFNFNLIIMTNNDFFKRTLNLY